jgi:leader peptidase (prepilin peptidase)/N-methyltransferase
LSWLLLRGRCYDCHEPISARYPLIELLTALVFLVLAWGEPLADARNLPDRLLPAEGVAFAEGWPFWHLWCVYAFHAALLFGLLAAALIEYDGHATPRQVAWPLWLVGVVAPLFAPWLRPVPAYPHLVMDLAGQPLLMGLIDGGAGAAVGLVMGLLASPATQHSPSGKTGVRTALFALVSVGLFLGWHAAAALAVIATFLFAALVIYRPAPQGRRFPFAGLVALAALAWILAWRRLVAFDARLGSEDASWLLAGAGTIVLLLALAANWVARRQHLEVAG